MSAAPQFQQTEQERRYLAALAVVKARAKALDGPSLWMRWARLSRGAREKILAKFSPGELASLYYAWAAWARPKQRPPVELTDEMRIILWLMGRGAGKTKSAAERVRERVDAGAMTIGLVAPTYDDADIYMLGVNEADEGLLNVFPPSQRPKYNVDKRVVRFHTGAVAYVYSAEKPDACRGPNFDTVWLDEPAVYRFLDAIWDNIEFSTRKPTALGIEILLTTTPRPLKFLKERILDSECLTLWAHTRENPHNDPRWLARMLKKYAGTRQGAQELEAEILGDDPDALFFSTIIDATRLEFYPPNLRIVIAVDPAISQTRKSDATGIMVLGIDDESGEIYVLADLSGKYSPDDWGDKVIEAYLAWGAEAVVGERNRGGDLVESNVRAAMFRKRKSAAAAKAVKFVNVHATRGKAIRAEPVSTLHKAAAIHVVGAAMKEFEEEITTWNPKLGAESPNRLDAFVWGVYYLAELEPDADPDVDGKAGFVGLEEANAIIRQRTQGKAKTPAAAFRRQAEASTSSSFPNLTPAVALAGQLPTTVGSGRLRRY